MINPMLSLGRGPREGMGPSGVRREQMRGRIGEWEGNGIKEKKKRSRILL